MNKTPKLIAIVNITPDSFSDGGKYYDPNLAIKYVEDLIDNGCSIIDIGAESTRPNATSLSHIEEWQRLKHILPQLVKLCKTHQVILSLDTRHYQNATKAIELGVDWINDVGGLSDKNMQLLAQDCENKFIIMHNLGIPSDKKNILPEDKDVVDIIYKWQTNKIYQLQDLAINKERIIFDPGIGFGKNAKQSLDIIKNIDRLKQPNNQILIGHSRKSFLNDFIVTKDNNNLTNQKSGLSKKGYDLSHKESVLIDKDISTLTCSMFLASKNIDYIRIHNFKIHKMVFDLFKILTKNHI